MAVPTAMYASTDEFRTYIRDPAVAADEASMTAALLSASREIDGWCGRHFYQHTDTQYFSPEPNSPWVLTLDDTDLATTDGLLVGVQWANGSNYSEVRTVDIDFIAEPRNQSVAGVEGWPFTSLRSLARMWPPRYSSFYMDTVQVTGTWGWPSLPDPVKQATLMLANEAWKAGDAPWGVAGFGAFGQVRVRDNPKVASKLQPYKKFTTLLMA